MTKKKTAYKIQNSKGLFSTGGTSPEFSSIGKTWSSLQNLTSHLTQGSHLWHEYSDCKVVEVVEIIHETEENLLHKICERSIVESSLRSPNAVRPEMTSILRKFVMYGKCYSSEFKELITERKVSYIDHFVPDYMIENFDIMHNKGIKGCSETELAAIILTATSDHQRMYNL